MRQRTGEREKARRRFIRQTLATRRARGRLAGQEGSALSGLQGAGGPAPGPGPPVAATCAEHAVNEHRQSVANGTCSPSPVRVTGHGPRNAGAAADQRCHPGLMATPKKTGKSASSLSAVCVSSYFFSSKRQAQECGRLWACLLGCLPGWQAKTKARTQTQPAVAYGCRAISSCT